MAKLFFPLTGGRASWGTDISQSWEVKEEKTASGRRRTLCQQVFPNWIFTLKFQHITKQERDEIMAFYANTRGRHKAFYFKDHEHRVEGQRLAKDADGRFSCVINYGGYTEPTSAVENLVVYLNGVQLTNDRYTETDGIITIPSAGSGVVTADYDYYWKVAFTGDLSISQLFEDVYEMGLKLEVIRE